MAVLVRFLSRLFIAGVLAGSVANAQELRRVTPAYGVADFGMPVEFRVVGNEAIVKTTLDRAGFLVVNLETGSVRRVTVRPPDGLKDTVVYSVDRLSASELVASAAWVEKGRSRGGLLYMDEQGVVSKSIGYGVSMRSLAAGPAGERIAVALQEPENPMSSQIGAPTEKVLGIFDGSGQPVATHPVLDRYQTFEEMRSHLPGRRLSIVGDTVLLSMPETTAWQPYPAIETLGPGAMVPPSKRSRSGGRVGDPGTILLKPPKDLPAPVRCVGIVPITVGSETQIVVAWLAGAKEGGVTPDRRIGLPVLTMYPYRLGAEPLRSERVKDGIRIAELGSSSDGRAFAITVSPTLDTWQLREITF